MNKLKMCFESCVNQIDLKSADNQVLVAKMEVALT